MGSPLSIIALCATIINVNGHCRGRTPDDTEYCSRWDDDFKTCSGRIDVKKRCEWNEGDRPTGPTPTIRSSDPLKEAYYKENANGNPGNWVRMTDDVYFAYLELLNVIIATDADGHYKDPLTKARALVSALKDEAMIFGIRRPKTTAEAARKELLDQVYDTGKIKTAVLTLLKKVPIVGQYAGYALGVAQWGSRAVNYFKNKALKRERILEKRARKIKIEPYSFYLYRSYEKVKFKQCRQWVDPQVTRDMLAVMNALPKKTFNGELTKYKEPSGLETFNVAPSDSDRRAARFIIRRDRQKVLKQQHERQRKERETNRKLDKRMRRINQQLATGPKPKRISVRTGDMLKPATDEELQQIRARKRKFKANKGRFVRTSHNVFGVNPHNIRG